MNGSSIVNTSCEVNGGAVVAFSGSRVTLAPGSSIARTQAGNAGGGMYLVHSAARIAGSWIADSAAEAGGGFAWITEDASLTITDSTQIVNATTSTQGGALILNRGSKAILANGSSIVSSMADGRAGAVLIESSSFTMRNRSSINGSHSVQQGGGIFLASGSLTVADESSI
eukprot:1745237-Prymnesium_polylepis.1